MIGEYKALIAFWNEVSVVEGSQVIGYTDKVQNYVAQVDEEKRNKLVSDFQKRVDALQDELDVYNFNTEIPWGDMTEGELDILDASVAKKDCDCAGNCSPVDSKE